MSYQIGDCRDLLRKLPQRSVDCVVTSPPYYGLRDYKIVDTVWGGDAKCSHAWASAGIRTKGGAHGDGVMLQGGRAVVQAQAEAKKLRLGDHCRCGAWKGCLGAEPSPDLYVSHLVEVFGEVRRVLRNDGTIWVNLGDSYARAGGERGGENRELLHLEGKQKRMGSIPPGSGLKSKDLIGIPWRVAFALQADGWWLRAPIIWHKTNPMPEAVTDRPTRCYEFLFLLSKAERYYYDADAIKEPVSKVQPPRRMGRKEYEGAQQESGHSGARKIALATGQGTSNSAGNHFGRVFGGESYRNKRDVWTLPTEPTPDAHFATFPRALVAPCIQAGSRVGGVVLDPFGGSGTVGRVAEDLGRQWVLFDLNPQYAKIAAHKTAQQGLERLARRNGK